MFFMLLTVIPVSKMLSSIFMKLVARVGTVDEDKWAMIGLGAIGATVGLMRRGDIGLGAKINSGNVLPRITNNSPNSSGYNGGATAGTNSPRPSNMPHMQNTISNSPNTTSSTTIPSGYTSTQPGAAPSANTSYQRENNQFEGNPIPPQGQRSLNDIINQSGDTGDKAAGYMAKMGAISSFAVPNVAPAMAGIYGAVGKGTAGMISTGSNLAKEIHTRRKNGQSFKQSLQDITGTSNLVSATSRVAPALILSPFGKTAAGLGTRTAGKVIDWSGKKLSL